MKYLLTTFTTIIAVGMFCEAQDCANLDTLITEEALASLGDLL